MRGFVQDMKRPSFHRRLSWFITYIEFMREITINIREDQYSLFLSFLRTLDYVQLKPNPSSHKRTYDFSDLAGKLKWQGDAVEMQRSLRDEW